MKQVKKKQMQMIKKENCSAATQKNKRRGKIICYKLKLKKQFKPQNEKNHTCRVSVNESVSFCS